MGTRLEGDTCNRLRGEVEVEDVVESLRHARALQDQRSHRDHPAEGLRARKRRLTRQLISDTATAMFATYGFEAVKVTEIADRANVSIKTLYNHFPTKEAMVFDDADDLVERVVTALSDWPDTSSASDAVALALGKGYDDLDLLDDEPAAEFHATFVDLITQTPALHSYWLTVLDRLASAATIQLARRLDRTPDDPALVIAGHALSGLVRVQVHAQARHSRDKRRGVTLRDAIVRDLDTAARSLDAGLSSLLL